MQASVLIGNDIVDLTLEKTHNKVDDTRFINRICAPEERAFLAEASDPNLTLWCLWSAKETAFKIVLKRWPDTGFHHSKFVVEAAPTFQDGETSVENVVRYQDMYIHVRWQATEQYVHCVGVWPENAISWDEVSVAVKLDSEIISDDEGFSERELQSVRTTASKQVRWLAKQLLKERGYNDIEIIRERADDHWEAPRIWHRDQRLIESGLSLSHHGQFLAAAVWVKEP